MPVANAVQNLISSVTSQTPSPFDKALAAVTEIADEMTQKARVATQQQDLSIEIQIGHLVNMGQQFRFVVKAPSIPMSDTLFRFYLPSSGYPATLALFEDEHEECQDKDQLQDQILKFLARTPIKQRLQALFGLARQRTP